MPRNGSRHSGTWRGEAQNRSTSIYGSNDWYYAYGQNTHDGILRDADLVASLAPAGGIRPFTVIDDGYQDPPDFPASPGWHPQSAIAM